MPTAKLFSNVPPFPDDIPTAAIPLISFTKLLYNDDVESERLFQAFRTVGFITLDLSGSQEGNEFLGEAEKLFKINEELFDVGEAELLKFTQPQPRILGYNALGTTKVESGAPDRFEWYCIGQDDLMGTRPPQPHPAPVEAKRELLKYYIIHAHAIATHLLSHLDKHLRLPAGTISSLQRQTEPSGTLLRFLRYPPQPKDDRQTSLLGHSDTGTMTILMNVLGGLQILPPGKENIEENWIYIKPQPGCAIINLGDMMVNWSGGILRSNMHRVTYAPGMQADCFRHSFGYFIRAEGKAPMKRLAYDGSVIPPPGEGDDIVNIDADEWVRRKTIAAGRGSDFDKEKDGKTAKEY